MTFKEKSIQKIRKEKRRRTQTIIVISIILPFVSVVVFVFVVAKVRVVSFRVLVGVDDVFCSASGISRCNKCV